MTGISRVFQATERYVQTKKRNQSPQGRGGGLVGEGARMAIWLQPYRFLAWVEFFGATDGMDNV